MKEVVQLAKSYVIASKNSSVQSLLQDKNHVVLGKKVSNITYLARKKNYCQLKNVNKSSRSMPKERKAIPTPQKRLHQLVSRMPTPQPVRTYNEQMRGQLMRSGKHQKILLSDNQILLL